MNEPIKEVVIHALTLQEKIERLSVEYNVNAKLAQQIIWCESSNNPNAIGTQAQIGRDIGYWQINTYYWEQEAFKSGFNIYNSDDNLVFGFILFSKYGSSPWMASSACWQ